MEQPRRQIRPRNAADRRLAALAHAAGLLGLSVVGWAIAPVLSIALLFLAGQRRSPYLAMHAGQAALYQMAIIVTQAVYLVWLGAGFLSLGGSIPNVANFRFFDDLVEPWLTLVQVLWGLSVLLWPVFTLLTVGLAALGAVRALRGRRFWYPVVSGRIRLLAEGPPEKPAEDKGDDDDDDAAEPDGQGAEDAAGAGGVNGSGGTPRV